ncbi:MAG: NAD-dependent epimerase/dehydratase family protein [Deltaproteobacteria bacterium]|nr:NAD-dependent epimerase/dehydratase family protein [Deltaproteobacteria bacterium]
MRVAVTGAAGYLGRALCAELAAQAGVRSVLAIDRLAPQAAWPEKVDFVRCDVCDPRLAELLRGCRALAHLAFCLGGGASDAEAHRCDVEGSLAVLGACARAGVERIAVASSVSAYGARPDLPRPIAETQPLGARPGFRYGFHKACQDRLAAGFAERHPELAVARLRICTVLGPPPRPGAVSRLLESPVLALPPGLAVQFVHVRDAAGAIALALLRAARGVFHVAAEPAMRGREIAAVTGQRYLALPAGPLEGARRLLGLAGLPDPGLGLLCHPIVVDAGKAREALGWAPRFDGPACLRALTLTP